MSTTIALILALVVFSGSSTPAEPRDLRAVPAATQATPSQVTQATPTQGVRSAEQAREPAGGGDEGIQVHGHWTIDVLDPDGTLVRHVEFDNALLPEASDNLVQLLDGGTPLRWALFLSGPDAAPIPCDGQPSCFGTSLPTEVRVGPGPDLFVILASFRMDVDSTIAVVGTFMTMTLPTGEETPPEPFTEKADNTLNVDVQAGQLVDVSVEISFS